MERELLGIYLILTHIYWVHAEVSISIWTTEATRFCKSWNQYVNQHGWHNPRCWILRGDTEDLGRKSGVFGKEPFVQAVR